MTSQAPAGWYPDPSGASARRWWDGQTWTAHAEPVMAQSVATATHPAAPGALPHRAATQSKNRFALMTLGVVALYVILAVETRFVLLGFLPLGLSLRSKRQGEPLAPLAIAAAGVSILLAAVLIFGH